MMRRALPGALLIALLAGGCGYFNSMYNANRRFADAQRAAAAGDIVAERRAYDETIEKAAVSYRRYPDSRWADDALLLIGRSHLALQQDERAVAAMNRLLEFSRDVDTRAAAHAVLGAALVRSGEADRAAPHLDSAVVRLRADTEVGALARLWRARAAFDAGRPDVAWQDLEDATAHAALADDASLEAVVRATALRDTARLQHAFAQLARADVRAVAPIAAALGRAAGEWSPAVALRASEPLQRARWRAALLDSVSMQRAAIAVAAGDTMEAVALATRVAENVTGGIGSSARLFAARLRLAAATERAGLEEVRLLLLPAFDNPLAVALQRNIRAVQILMLRGDSPASAISLFAAAEMARDDLAAPRLARALFLDFAALVPESAWAGKAVLAAHLIHDDNATRAALERWRDTPYIRSAQGAAGAAEIDVAEERLARGIRGLRADALAEAVQRDVVVGRAVSVLDSSRAAARSDSVRIACGTLIDTLNIAGIRADSTRTACLRGDSARVAFVLRADTTLLRDTVVTGQTGVRVRPPIPDTLPR